MMVSGIGGCGLCRVRDHINDFRLHIAKRNMGIGDRGGGGCYVERARGEQ